MANMTFKTNLLPNSNLDYSLGDSTHKWKINGVDDPKLTGTVTKVSTGAGLTGGDITNQGTVKANLNSETSLGTIGTTDKLYAVGVDANGKLAVNVPWINIDTKVTSVDNHYTPSANASSELTASLSGIAGSYALNTEYTVLTGVKAQRDAKGHITGLTYTAQKIKDTNTTYTLAGLMGSTEKGSETKPIYWDGSKFDIITSYEGNAATATKLAIPRSLKVKLNSTTAVTFDGSADQEAIPVTGTLPVANGGTGATTFTSGTALIGNGTGAITTRGIRNNTTEGALGWTSNSTDITLTTTNTIAYWNGAYANTSSNLTYSANGIIMGLSTAQTVSGTKTFSAIQKFTNITDSTYSKDTAAAISTSGGISVEKQLSAKSIRIDNNENSKGVQLVFNSTTNALDFVFA